MFVYSLKASKIKVIALLALFAAVAVLVLPRATREDQITDVLAKEKGIRFDGIKTEEDLYRFISEIGIEVKTPALKCADVDIPRVFDSVYKKYNDIQKQQGFNLEKYRGKTLRRYTFEVLNYPTPEESGNGKAYLTLFTYKNKIVGGDISSRDFGGFVRTFVDYAGHKSEES